MCVLALHFKKQKSVKDPKFFLKKKKKPNDNISRRKKKKKNKKTDVRKKYEHSSLFSLRFSHRFREIEFW